MLNWYLLIALIMPSTLWANAFQNNMHSELIVSPAQIYQVRRAKVDMLAAAASETYRSETAATNRKVDASANDLRLALVTPIFAGVALGVNIRQMAVDFRQQQRGFQLLSPEMHGRNVFTEYAATLAVPLAGSIYLGVQYKAIETELPEGSSAEREIVQPGLTIAGNRSEVGLSYIPQTTETIRATIAETDERLRKHPAEWIFHGRYAFNLHTSLGLIAKHKIVRVVDDAEEQFGHDKNITEAAVTLERRVSRFIKVDGIASYATTGDDVDSGVLLYNVPGLGLSGNIDYRASRRFTLSVNGRYQGGEQTVADDSDYNSGAVKTIATNRYYLGVGAQVKL